MREGGPWLDKKPRYERYYTYEGERPLFWAPDSRLKTIFFVVSMPHECIGGGRTYESHLAARESVTLLEERRHDAVDK